MLVLVHDMFLGTLDYLYLVAFVAFLPGGRCLFIFDIPLPLILHLSLQLAMVSYSIQKVPASTPAADLAAILRKDGALVVQRLVEPAILDTIHQELAPKTIGPLVALAAKSKTFATELLTNSVAQEVASLILTRSTGSCWGPEKSVSTSIHRLSAATLFLHGPGYEGDDLMREDEAHHVRHPASPVEADLGIVFAGTALRAGAGARKVILLSNHWDDEKVPRSELAEDVELDAGDALFL